MRRGTEIVPLTNVEFRLLLALVSADGRVLTRDQLLDVVYGQDDADILDRTIDVHIGRLREKLGDDAAAPRYVATVRGVGYRAAPAPTPVVGGRGRRDEPVVGRGEPPIRDLPMSSRPDRPASESSPGSGRARGLAAGWPRASRWRR